MNRPLVSVIVTTYNRPKRLDECLESVDNQTYDNLEVWVVDGSDSDVNKGIVEKYGFNYVGLDVDLGVQYARNLGWMYSSGKYLAMLDDDDIWYPKKLEKQVEVAEENDNIGLVVCHSKTKTEYKDFVEKPSKDITFKNLLMSFNLSFTSTYLIRTIYLNEIGGWNQDLESMHEYDIGLRLARRGHEIKAVQEVLVDKNNYFFDESRKYFGSIYMKIHEVFLLWKYYGEDMLDELSLPEFILNGIKTAGLLFMFTLGYIFGDNIRKPIYSLKEYYLNMVT